VQGDLPKDMLCGPSKKRKTRSNWHGREIQKKLRSGMATEKVEGNKVKSRVRGVTFSVSGQNPGDYKTEVGAATFPAAVLEAHCGAGLKSPQPEQ